MIGRRSERRSERRTANGERRTANGERRTANGDCERIVRYAFAHARAHGRKKVTCMTKDNIMKLTDGLFHRVFDEVAGEYLELTAEHMIVDIGAARLADTSSVWRCSIPAYRSSSFSRTITRSRPGWREATKGV